MTVWLSSLWSNCQA